MDQKYCQLKSRKENLLKLYERMKKFQLEQISLLTKKQQEIEEKKNSLYQDKNISEEDKEFEIKKINEDEQSILRIIDTIRILEESELKKVENIQTIEEFYDYYHHFHLHYGSDLIPMKEFEIRSQKHSKNKHKKKLKEKDNNIEENNSEQEFENDNDSNSSENDMENQQTEDLKFNKFASK